MKEDHGTEGKELREETKTRQEIMKCELAVLKKIQE